MGLRLFLKYVVIEDAYGDAPPPPSFVEGPTSVEVLSRLSLLSKADGIGENLKVFERIWLFLAVLRSDLVLEKQVPRVPEGSWGALEVVLGPLGWPKTAPGASWRRFGPSWRRLGPSWSRLGGPWGVPGGSWEGPGSVLGRLGAVLGPAWALLGPSWGPLGTVLGVLGRPGGSWGRLGAVLGVLGGLPGGLSGLSGGLL